jgi:K+-transporting ATPase ATPase C chain
MKREAFIALRMALATLVLTGLLYPLGMTAVAQLAFPKQADGSLMEVDGRTVGSRWIAQPFVGPAYFQPRPSAAGADGYDAAASSGSNLGPTSRKLRDRVAADLVRLRAENPAARGSVPIELVTTSASGLDPHLSPAAARWQAPRIAAARGAAVADVEAMIAARTEQRTLGWWGEPRINVLLLNLDLDERFGRPTAPRSRHPGRSAR